VVTVSNNAGITRRFDLAPIKILDHSATTVEPKPTKSGGSF